MSEYFSKPNSLGPNVKVELDSSNNATKTDLKNVAGVDTSSFAKKIDLVNLKSDVDKLDIDKLKNIPSALSSLKSKVDQLDIDKLKNLSSKVDQLDIDKFKYVPSGLTSLKSKVDKLDTDKLVPAPIDLSKLSDVVKNDVAKKNVYNAMLK